MHHSGRYGLFILFLISITLSSLSAQEQIVFFSQSDQQVKTQEHIFFKQLNATRKLIFLNGPYDLLDAGTGERLGEISLPSVSHHNRSFVFRRDFPRQTDHNSQYVLYVERLIGQASISINDQLIFEGNQNFLSQSIPVDAALLTQTENSIEIHLKPWRGRDDQLPMWFPINLPA